jgi:TRAP-type C4-dicarboxylate transport system permease small subunit
VSDAPRRSGIVGAANWLIHAWAIAGGVLLLAVVLVNVLSVVGRIFGMPFPGDFELTEMGVAVAAFAFLPYCQLTDANVTADIFTAKAPERWVSIFRLAAALVALLFALLLAWRMYYGAVDQRTYGYTTAILQIPIWWAFVPILFSLVLLAAASLITLIENGRAAYRGNRIA